MNTRPLGILLADDHTIFRSGVRRLLEEESDLRVDGEAGNAAEVIAALERRHFDLLLLDINMDGRSGFDVLAAIRPTRASLPVLMLSMYPEEQYALLAIQHGANGYVAKDAEPGELVIAIRQVAAGNTYLSAGAAYHIAAQMNGQDDRAAHQRLSMREYQIFLMLIKGRSLTDIGEEMMISIKTVSTHKSHILDKLGVATIADLVRYGVRHGLID